MRLSVRTYLLFSLIVAVIGAAGYASVWLHNKNKGPDMPSGFSSLFKNVERFRPPQKPADTVLYGLDGSQIKLSALKGKWRLVNFWATWCPPCLKELPTLIQLDNHYKNNNFEVVFVSFDFPVSAEDLKSKMEKTSIALKSNVFYVKDIDAWGKLGVNGIPTSFVYGPDGKTYFKLVGDIDWAGPESLAFFDNITIR